MINAKCQVEYRFQLTSTTRIEPAGAGGATGASHQLRRHQLGRGGKEAPQSPLEESATTEASRMWHGNVRVRWSYCSKNPFIECSFHEITIEFLLELVQKAACKKLNRITHRHADRIQPISSSAVAMFWTVHTQIPFANASKTCPQNDPRIPVNISFKERVSLECDYNQGFTYVTPTRHKPCGITY